MENKDIDPRIPKVLLPPIRRNFPELVEAEIVGATPIADDFDYLQKIILKNRYILNSDGKYEFIENLDVENFLEKVENEK